MSSRWNIFRSTNRRERWILIDALACGDPFTARIKAGAGFRSKTLYNAEPDCRAVWTIQSR